MIKDDRERIHNSFKTECDYLLTLMSLIEPLIVTRDCQAQKRGGKKPTKNHNKSFIKVCLNLTVIRNLPILSKKLLFYYFFYISLCTHTPSRTQGTRSCKYCFFQ